MIYFVQRNGQGTVVGIYGNLCVGIAEEELPDNNQEIIAFLNPPPPIPSVSRRQFFQQSAIAGIITQDEALAAVTTGALPASITAFVNGLPSNQQFGTKMLFSADTFDRSSSIANAFGQTIGMTPTQIDAFFTAASQL